MGKLKRMIVLVLSAALVLSVAPVAARAVEAAAGESRYIVIEPTPPEGRQYYGRTILESMEKTALLYAYDQIVAGVENAETEIDVYNGLFPITVEEIKLVMSVYRRDYAHHFWLDNGYSYSYSSQTVYTVKPRYLMTGNTLTEAKAKFEAEADKILSGITEDMSDYEKELYIHDTLAQRIVYAESGNAHNAYGALVEGVAVCEGYAEAFQYLLHRADIWSYIVIGSSRGVGHAWNMVQIDGEYYHVDLTWNDQESDIYHAYFNVTDEMIRKDHTIEATTYDLPECTAADAFYFTGKDTYLESYTAESVGSLLRDNDLRIHVYIDGDLNTALRWYGDNVLDIADVACINGSFSYGYSYMGNEVVFYIKGMGVKVTDSTDTCYYRTVATALDYCADGSKLRLVGDLTENIQTGYALDLDLNGYDIAGDLTAPNTIIYDSQTDDYTVNNGNGYGVITGTVTGAAPAEGYIPVAGEEGVSYHKVDVALDKLVLKADSAGLYYTGSFCYDEIVANSLTAAGVALSTQNTAPVADGSDPGSLYTDSGNSALLKNILQEGNTTEQNRKNAKHLIYARAYMKLKDGTIIYSETNTTNLQAMVETVDAVAWDRLSSVQKEALTAMYQTYTEEMATWNIPNLKTA